MKRQYTGFAHIFEDLRRVIKKRHVVVIASKPPETTEPKTVPQDTVERDKSL